MDESRDYHTKWNKPYKDKYHMKDKYHLYESKKGYKWTYLQNRNKLTDIENKLKLPKGGGIN